MDYVVGNWCPSGIGRRIYCFRAAANTMKPSILNPDFKYVHSSKTDIRKTIAKELRRLAELKRLQTEADAEAAAKVEPIKRRKA